MTSVSIKMPNAGGSAMSTPLNHHELFVMSCRYFRIENNSLIIQSMMDTWKDIAAYRGWPTTANSGI